MSETASAQTEALSLKLERRGRTKGIIRATGIFAPANRTRAKQSRIESGSDVDCEHCGDRVKFKASQKLSQVICNVYVEKDNPTKVDSGLPIPEDLIAQSQALVEKAAVDSEQSPINGTADPEAVLVWSRVAHFHAESPPCYQLAGHPYGPVIGK